MKPPKWRPRWDDYKPTGNKYGGYMPPKKGEWEVAGMVERTRPAMYNAGYTQIPNPLLPRYKTGEMVPLWRRKTQAPAITSTGSYSNSPASTTTPEELADRRTALERSQEYARQAMSQIGRIDGSSSAPSGGSAPPEAPASSTSGNGPVSFADMMAYGRTYNAAADAGRIRDAAMAQAGIPEIAYANERLIQGVDPSKMNISDPKFKQIKKEVRAYKRMLK